ncbi:MAG: hypothetical protein EU539_00565 [Promethearchaeota archaeon]|nr:MAG: hypothetical protein EU539_00565 [Candidatus Lokiarchaeota archaeon]
MQINVKLSRFTLIFGFLLSLGLLLIGIFPVKNIGVVTIEHSVAAFLYWSGSLLFWLFLGLTEYSGPKELKIQAYVALTSFLFWLFFIGYLFLEFFLPHFIFNLEKFPQWLAHFIVVGSLIEHCLYFRKLNPSQK